MTFASPVEISDRIEITDLLIAYSWAIDGGDAEALADLFVPDGRFHRADGTVSRGRDELMAFALRVYGAHPERLQHVASNISLSQTAADRVAVRSYVQVLAASAAGPKILALGGYVDDVVKTSAGWRFASRTFQNWRSEPAGTPE